MLLLKHVNRRRNCYAMLSKDEDEPKFSQSRKVQILTKFV